MPRNAPSWSAAPALAAGIAGMLLFSPAPAVAHPEELAESIQDERNVARAMPKEPARYGRPLWELDARVPFIGSPVHEKMTVQSINLSGVHPRQYTVSYDEAYIHGVFWSDDPDDLLCPECSASNVRNFDRRWGLSFAARFEQAKKRARESSSGPGHFFVIGEGLLERSHFGDLQFLHAMAARDGELASETQRKILKWAEFAYKVAVGEISQKVPIAKIPIVEIRDLLAAEPALEGRTIEQMFRGPRLAKRVAIGTLLHMIQDSYAGGHAEREQVDSGDAKSGVFARGKIRRFHSYANQDPTLHGNDDAWPRGLSSPSPDTSDNPISVGARILRFMYADAGDGAPWKQVETYLRNVVFAITDPNAVAGPGEKYRRR